MSDIDKELSFHDEIRIGFSCIKKGLVEFANLNSTSVVFIPLLLLSVGFERILKVLYCFGFQKENGQYPNKKEMKKISHDLNILIEGFIENCNMNSLYKKASARINDLNFLKNNLDFNQLIRILNDFAKNGRYYNLDLISGEADYKKPESLVSKFLNEFIQRYPELYEQICNPPYNSKVIYDKFNPYIIELVQTFVRILCFGFTQGAFGDEARNLSAGLINDFLLIRDEHLSEIRFKK